MTLADFHSGSVDFVEATYAEALRRFADRAAAAPAALAMRGVGGAPDWSSTEMAVWEMSEEVRHYLQAKRQRKGRSAVAGALQDVAGAERLGKGRQNVVLLLAQFGGPSYGPAIGELLADEDVEGHALKALDKLRDPAYVKDAERLAAHARLPATRRIAKTYLKRHRDP